MKPYRPWYPRNAAWNKVLNDVFDRRIDHRHSCAAVRAALQHMPLDNMFSKLPEVLRAYQRKVC